MVEAIETSKKVPRRRFVGKKPGAPDESSENGSALVSSTKNKHLGRVMNQIPDDILNDKELNEAIKLAFAIELQL